MSMDFSVFIQKMLLCIELCIASYTWLHGNKTEQTTSTFCVLEHIKQ